jgi:hypothetical protein
LSSKFIKSKKTPKEKQPPKDLLDKWACVQATSTAFTVVDKAYLPHSYHTVLKATLSFLSKLHEQCMEDVLKHPDCDMISEVREIKKQEQEAKNGKTEEIASQ